MKSLKSQFVAQAYLISLGIFTKSARCDMLNYGSNAWLQQTVPHNSKLLQLDLHFHCHRVAAIPLQTSSVQGSIQ